MVGRLNHLARDVGGEAGRRAARAVRTHRRRRPTPQDLLRRHAAPARRRRGVGGPAQGAVPRRAHHRARPPEPSGRVGDDRSPGGARAPASCSPPSTSRRPTPWPVTIAVVDHGRVIAEGTPTQLKADLGATVLDIGLADAELARQAAGILASVGGQEPDRRRAPSSSCPSTTGPGWPWRSCACSTSTRWSPPPSRSVSPASTTCSWPSRASGPRADDAESTDGRDRRAPPAPAPGTERLPRRRATEVNDERDHHGHHTRDRARPGWRAPPCRAGRHGCAGPSPTP